MVFADFQTLNFKFGFLDFQYEIAVLEDYILLLFPVLQDIVYPLVRIGVNFVNELGFGEFAVDFSGFIQVEQPLVRDFLSEHTQLRSIYIASFKYNYNS